MKKLLLFPLSILLFLGCKHSSSISGAEAGQRISVHLKAHPEAKTEKIDVGEQKFNSKKEMIALAKYRQLADSGYATLTLIEAKKKFLSADSSYTYKIGLTQKSIPYVIEQKNDKAVVRVFLYSLADENPVEFTPVNDNNVKATVSLKKIDTPFTPFADDENADEFITKTYKLKFSEEQGWAVKN